MYRLQLTHVKVSGDVLQETAGRLQLTHVKVSGEVLQDTAGRFGLLMLRYW